MESLEMMTSHRARKKFNQWLKKNKLNYFLATGYDVNKKLIINVFRKSNHSLAKSNIVKVQKIDFIADLWIDRNINIDKILQDIYQEAHS